MGLLPGIRLDNRRTWRWGNHHRHESENNQGLRVRCVPDRIMSIRAIRLFLEEQGWEVVATNTRNGRFYHAEHRELKRSFAGLKDGFKHQAQQELIINCD